LGNTYHLMLRPGGERLARLGGLHRFMDWDKPILTDSGGFQVWSLAGLRRMSEAGVEFRSHIDGSKHMLTPERSIELQADLIGSDIVMHLDECTTFGSSRVGARAAKPLLAAHESVKPCLALFKVRFFQILGNDQHWLCVKLDLTVMPLAVSRWGRAIKSCARPLM
jgi:tRNA-guanine family transglycosylase